MIKSLSKWFLHVPGLSIRTHRCPESPNRAKIVQALRVMVLPLKPMIQGLKLLYTCFRSSNYAPGIKRDRKEPGKTRFGEVAGFSGEGGRRRWWFAALRAAALSPELRKLHHLDPRASRNTMVQELVRIDQKIRRKGPLKIEKTHRKIRALGFFVSRS